MKKTGIIIFLILGIAVGVNAVIKNGKNSPSIHFKHISIDEGLSQNSIYCTLQDKKGFLWFGTQDGLNKYDGYNFTVYKPDPDDPKSLSDGFINTFIEDNSGILWIGTNKGLNRFDPRTETFFRYPYDEKSFNSTQNIFISTICQDKSGAIWFGTRGSGITKIIRLDHNQETFVRYRRVSSTENRQNHPRGISSNFISRIYEDRQGKIWIGTGDSGLDRFDPKTGGFTHYVYASNSPKSLSFNSISSIYEDSSGSLWIGTFGGGLNLMDKNTGEFTRYMYDPENPETISNNIINTIFEDRSGVIWVGTINGLNRFDKRSKTFTRYTHDTGNPYSLINNNVLSIFEDKSRILWIGTGGNGLNKFDRNYKFDTFRSIPNNPNSLSENLVYSICEDRQGILWVGTSSSGLDRFDRKTGIVTHYRNDPKNPRSLSFDAIRCILETRDGELLIGTDGGGINSFNRKTGQFIRYNNIPNNVQSLSNDSVRVMYEDKAGNVWVGTLMGLNLFNREKKTFVRYFADFNSLNINRIVAICESGREPHTLWIATGFTGLTKFNSVTNTFVHYTSDPENPKSLSGNTTQCVYEDKNGTLWIGTLGAGLNRMTTDSTGNPIFEHYTEKNGLANNTVYGILEDEKGNLWLSTNKGLSSFNPRAKAFKNYNVKDGLQGNEFNGGSYFKSSSGEMFFGGINGFNAFFPSKFRVNPYIPPVVITDFKLQNAPVSIGPHSPLKRSIVYTERLKLNYFQNILFFQFASLDYTIPEKNIYFYKMEGYDDNWIETDASKRFATYSKLPPGNYKFQVKGSNSDGRMNETGASIDIIITPPFWQTWWFQLIIIICILGFVILMYRKRLQNVRIMTELQTAHDAQMSIMPQFDPEVENFDISGICVPANEVGGDFFDYIWLNEEKTKFGIAIGDVSGKAMKSAMTAVMTSGMIYMEADEHHSVKDILKRVNRPLYFKTGKKVFTALCMASFDLKTKEITFTNAGLNAPILKSHHTVSILRSDGTKLPLGIKPDPDYEENKYALKTGDMIVLYTDGITDAKNAMSQFYDSERLMQFISRLDDSVLTAAQIKTKIIEDTQKFAGETPQHDDMTVIVIKVL